MSSTFFRRTTALLAGAATLAASALIAAPAATAGLPPSPYTLSVVASGASPYYLSLPEGVALDSNGNLFVADSGQFGVKMIAPNGTPTNIAGYVDAGGPTPGPALDSMFSSPRAVAVDSSGNVYIADSGSNMIAKVTSGTLSIFTSSVSSPSGLAVDSSGNVYVADTGHHQVKKFTPGGSATVIAGTGTAGAPTAGTATSSTLRSPGGVAVDSSGNVYIADTGNHRIEKVTSGGTLSIIAGTGSSGAPTAGVATSSTLNTPGGVAVDSSGNVYIADTNNHRIEKVTSGGTLSIIAGTGSAGAPTAGPGSSSALNYPRGIAVDSSGFVYVGDTSNNRVEKLVGSVTAPAAPTSLSATPGDTTASIAFTAGSDGGASITKYQYTTNDGTNWYDAAAGTTSPINITGLTNDTNYSIKIRAYNSAGGGTASSAVSVTPTAAVSAPSAPTGLSTTPGNASASIAFTAGFNGGASITKYQYTTNDGTNWYDAAAGTTSPINITGLTNDTNYSIKIRAYNSAGGGTASSAVSVTPRTTPSAPTSLSVTPGNMTATITFTAGSDGGSPILRYTYSLDGGSTWTYLGLGLGSPLTITELPNGTTFNISLQAITAIGASPASAPVTVTPRAAPAAPTIDKVTLGNGSASLAITPGADNGAAITKYEVRVGEGAWTDAGSTSPLLVTGLTNYSSNLVRVRAVNAAGPGAGAWVSVRPRTTAPTLTSASAAGRRTVHVEFSGLTILGASINGYDGIAYLKGTDTVVSTCHVDFRGRGCDINSLNPNTEYDIRVISFFRFTGGLTNSETLESTATVVRTSN